MSMQIIKTREFGNGKLKLLKGDYLGQRHHNYVIRFESSKTDLVHTFVEIPQWHWTDETEGLVEKMFEQISYTFDFGDKEREEENEIK